MNAPSDPEDPHDANYLRETSVRFLFFNIFLFIESITNYAVLKRRAHKEALEQNAMAASMETGDTSAAAASQGDEDLVVDSLGGDAVVDDIQQPQQQQVLNLDQAILYSIDRCCKSL